MNDGFCGSMPWCLDEDEVSCPDVYVTLSTQPAVCLGGGLLDKGLPHVEKLHLLPVRSCPAVCVAAQEHGSSST
jgi:hypothetical protein